MNYEEALEMEQIFQQLSQHEDEAVRNQAVRLIEVFTPMIEVEKDREFKRQRNLKHSWGTFIPKNEVTKIITVLNCATKMFDDAENELKHYQQEQQDILHAYEIDGLTEEDVESLSNGLRELRVQRRKTKNFIEQVRPLKELADNNQQFLRDTIKAQKELLRTFQKLQDKRYFVRDCEYLKSILPNKKEQIDKGCLELIG